MKRESFIFHSDWLAPMSLLSDREQLELFKAIVAYGLTGNLPKLGEKTNLVFASIKPAFDRDKVRYMETSEARRRASNKRWHVEDMQMHTNDANDANASKPMQNIQAYANDANDADNDNVYVNDNDIIKEEPPKGGKKKDALSSSTHTPLELLEKRKKAFHDSLVPYVDKYGKEMIRVFYDYWTEPNKSKSKMRYELEKTWDTSRRLATWAARDSSSFRNGTTQSTKPDIEAIQQREDENAERNRRYEEMRRNAVSREEAMKAPEYLRALQES